MFALLAVLVSACAHLRPPEEFVAAVRFEGNVTDRAHGGPLAPQTDVALADSMAQESAGWQRVVGSILFPRRVDLPQLDTRGLADDGRRVETWYAHHGYFDAKFLGWEVVRPRARGVRRPIVLVGHVEQGLPSTIRTLSIEGWEGVDRVLRGAIADRIDLEKGDIFTIDAYDDSVATIRAELADHAFAFATVDGEVRAWPEEHAVDVTIRVSPGLTAKFGEVTVEGNEQVPDALLLREITIDQGKGYSTTHLARTRSRLFGLRVFSIVDVVPDLSQPDSRVVPVRIHVVENKARSMEVGPELTVQGSLQSASVHATYRDENALRRLWKWEQTSRLGVATRVEAIDEPLFEQVGSTIAPIAQIGEKLAIPRMWGTPFGFETEGSAALSVYTGYRTFSPEAGPSFTWKGLEDVTVSLGYRFRYVDYCQQAAIGASCPDFETTTGLESIEEARSTVDFRDPYFLSLARAGAVYDGRNDPLSATRGLYGALDATSAGGVLGGTYDFYKLAADLRAYRSVVRIGSWDPDVVLAGRIAGGWIIPHREDAAVAWNELFFLGGGNTVRGWPQDRIGECVVLDVGDDDPVAADPALLPQCDDPALDVEGSVYDDDKEVPLGGLLQAYGSAEIRKKLPFGLGLVLFADAGQLWQEPGEVRFVDLLWTAGAGLRYRSPVGPIRFDVGYRLGGGFAWENFGFHLGLGEAF